MTRTTLSRTTALTLCLALSTPGAGFAQSNTDCTGAADQSCENAVEQSALAAVLAVLASGGTPSADQIDSLNKGELMKLVEQRNLTIDPRGMRPAELRAAVKAELGLDNRAQAEAGTAQEQDGTTAEGLITGAVNNLADALSPAEDGTAQADASAQAGASASTEADVMAEADTTAASDTDAASRQRAALTVEDIRGMNRGALVRLIRRRGLPIEVQGTAAPELRTAVIAELGLSSPAPKPRPESADGSLGEALGNIAEGAIGDLEDTLGMDEQQRAQQEAETERRRAEEDAADGPPMAATADAEADAGAKVTTETVTEDVARSSDEAFQSQLETGAQATAQLQSQTSDGTGSGDALGNLGQAVALGIGALALNEILDGNDEVVASSNDRVVVRDDGNLRVLKNDDAYLLRPGNDVQTRTFADGSTRTVITRDNGSKVVTIRAADGRVLRRVRVRADGSRVVIFDDTQQQYEPVDVRELPEPQNNGVTYSGRDQAALEAALNAELAADVDRRFSLRQVRNIRAVRKLMPPVTLDAINFRTDSAVIRPREAEDLAALGQQMAAFIDRNPDEVFLVEGHTDTVGRASYNLALSDRRAESVALALVEYFDVPPENLVVQGYGEADLAVPVAGPERANRRATVRRITPLLARSNG